MAEEEVEEQEGSGGSRSKLLILVVAGVLVLGGGGVGAVLFLKGDAAEGDPAASESAEPGSTPDGEGAPQVAFFSMEPFVVNIGDGDRDRFLKLKIDLEVSSADVSSELEQRLPQIKDIMIGLLSSQSFADIRSMDGKEALREELQTRLNAVVRRGTVQQVFFTEFVVQ